MYLAMVSLHHSHASRIDDGACHAVETIVHGRAGISFDDADTDASYTWRRVYANASSLSWHYNPTHMPICIDLPIAALTRR